MSSSRVVSTVVVERARLLAVSMCLYGCTQTSAPFPVDKPATTPLSAWTAQAEERLSVTARLRQDSVSQGFGMNASTFRVWKVAIQVRNDSGRPLETGDEFVVVETSRPAPEGARDPSPLEVTSGTFNLKPFEDYGGVHEKLGGDVDDEEAHGLYNIQSVGTGGGMIRRMGNMTMFTYGGEGREWRTYGRAAPGGSLELEVDFQAAVHVVKTRLDRVVVIPPALILRDGDKSAAFRYLLTFAPETQGSKEDWRLDKAQLLAMQAEPLLAILDGAQEPLWRRVFAASWAGEHAYAAAKPSLVALIDSRGKINERLRIAGMNGLAVDQDAELTAKVLAIAKDRSEDKRVRWAALRALGQLADPSATPFLVGVMNGKDDAEAAEAIVALRLGRNPAAADPLLAVLQNSKRERQHGAAAKALALVADDRHLAALGKLAQSKARGTADAAVTAMAGVKTSAAVAALAQLAAAGGEASGKAIESLGESDLPDAVAALKKLLAEGKPETKGKVVGAIGAKDAPERVALLRESLASSDKGVREQAAWRAEGLGSDGGPRRAAEGRGQGCPVGGGDCAVEDGRPGRRRAARFRPGGHGGGGAQGRHTRLGAARLAGEPARASGRVEGARQSGRRRPGPRPHQEPAKRGSPGPGDGRCGHLRAARGDPGPGPTRLPAIGRPAGGPSG
jgi:HEAT repeat protein